MKQSSKALLWLALLLALVIAFCVVLFQPPPPDQTQILSQLEVARAAGERHDVGGIMSVVSEKYSDPNVPGPVQLRFVLNKYLRGAEPVQVTQSIPVVSVTGDTATSTSHLRVVSLGDNRVLYDHDVTMQWKREEGTRLFVVPTKVWRVTSADYGFSGLSLMGD